MKKIYSFTHKYGSRGKFDLFTYTLFLTDKGIYKLHEDITPREGKQFTGRGQPPTSHFMGVTLMAKRTLKTEWFKEHHQHFLRYKSLYKLSNAEFFFNFYKWETVRRKVYYKRHYPAIRLMNNRIEARKYSGLLPASKATFIYIIKVGEFTKFGIADDIMQRMYDYKAEFGGYEIYDV